MFIVNNMNFLLIFLFNFKFYIKFKIIIKILKLKDIFLKIYYIYIFKKYK